MKEKSSEGPKKGLVSRLTQMFSNNPTEERPVKAPPRKLDPLKVASFRPPPPSDSLLDPGPSVIDQIIAQTNQYSNKDASDQQPDSATGSQDQLAGHFSEDSAMAFSPLGQSMCNAVKLTPFQQDQSMLVSESNLSVPLSLTLPHPEVHDSNNLNEKIDQQKAGRQCSSQDYESIQYEAISEKQCQPGQNPIRDIKGEFEQASEQIELKSEEAGDCREGIGSESKSCEPNARPANSSSSVEPLFDNIKDEAEDEVNSHSVSDEVSQQTFNHTFLDTLDSDFSPSQAPAPTPQYETAPHASPSRHSASNSDESDQDKDEDKLGQDNSEHDASLLVPIAKETESQTSTISANNAQDSVVESSLQEVPQNEEAQVQLPARVPSLQLSTVSEDKHDDADAECDSSGTEDDNVNPESLVGPSQQSLSEASVQSHRLGDSASDAGTDRGSIADAKVEISIGDMKFKESSQVKVDRREEGKAGPSTATRSRATFCSPESRKIRMRGRAHRSNSRSPLLSQARQNPGRARISISKRNSPATSLPKKKMQISQNRGAQQPHRVSPESRKRLKLSATEKSKNGALGKPIYGEQGSDSQKTENDHGVSQPQGSEVIYESSSNATSPMPDLPDYASNIGPSLGNWENDGQGRLKIEIPGQDPSLASPSSILQSPVQTKPEADPIVPRSHVPEPTYKIPTLKLPVAAAPRWQNGVSQSLHPRQIRRDLLQKEKERVLLLAQQTKGDFAANPSQAHPSGQNRALDATSLKAEPSKHSWTALTPDCPPEAPQDFGIQSKTGQAQTFSSLDSEAWAKARLQDAAEREQVLQAPKEVKRVRFADACQVLEDNIREKVAVRQPQAITDDLGHERRAAAKAGLWSGTFDLTSNSFWQSRSALDSNGGQASQAHDVDRPIDLESSPSRSLDSAVSDIEPLETVEEIVRDAGALWSTNVSTQMELPKALQAPKSSSWKPNPKVLTKSSAVDMFGDMPSKDRGFTDDLDIRYRHDVARRANLNAPLRDDLSVDSDIIRPVIAQAVSRTPSSSFQGLHSTSDWFGPPPQPKIVPNKPSQTNAQRVPSASKNTQEDKTDQSQRRKLPTMGKPIKEASQKQYAAPQWTSHTSTKALLQQLSYKQGTQAPKIGQLDRRNTANNVNNHLFPKSHNKDNGSSLTASKTGPLWTAPATSLLDWDQSTVMSADFGEEQSISPSSPTSVRAHPLSFCGSPRSQRASWSPDMQAVQEVSEEEYVDELGTDRLSVMSFRPTLPTQMLQHPPRLTLATLQNRAVLDTVACDMDLGMLQSIWPGSSPNPPSKDGGGFSSADFPRDFHSRTSLGASAVL